MKHIVCFTFFCRIISIHFVNFFFVVVGKYNKTKLKKFRRINKFIMKINVKLFLNFLFNISFGSRFANFIALSKLNKS